MAKLTKVEFMGADHAGRQGMAHALHGLVQAAVHGKRSGDHVALHYDDGSTVKVVLKGSSVTAHGVTVDVDEGVEP